MADNFNIPDIDNNPKTMATREVAGVHRPIAANEYFDIEATFTRPSNSTAYSAGDAVNNSTSSPLALTFADIANRVGGLFTITNARIYSSIGTGSAQLDLLLFNGSAAPTAQNDNAVFAPSDGDMVNCFGAISFPTSQIISGSNNKIWYQSNLCLAGVCNGSIDDIFGLLRINGSYTPGSAEEFRIRLTGFRD